MACTKRTLVIVAIAALVGVGAIAGICVAVINSGSSGEGQSSTPSTTTTTPTTTTTTPTTTPTPTVAPLTCSDTDRLRVSIKQGTVAGKCNEGWNSSKYASFEGIPYAKPPLGELRFKSPEPPESFASEYDATAVKSKCRQVNSATKDISGSENCLFLNVYTPRLPVGQVNPRLPVLFNIHGGGYQTGSGGDFQVAPLVRHDIVFVSINYRLNAFGFLNLEKEYAPGNVGLKDQVMALQWVRDNIEAFGGDPNQVTLCGQSAGSASAHYLTILPETRDMIRGSILMGGSAMLSWSYTEVPLEYGNAFLKAARSTNSAYATYSDEQVLQQASEEELTTAYVSALQDRDFTRPGVSIEFGPTPSLEAASLQSRLIRQDPESLILEPTRPAVPILAGITHCEWAAIAAAYDAELDNYLQDENYMQFIPSNAIPWPDTQRVLNINTTELGFSFDDVLTRVKEHFFPIGADADQRRHRMHEYMAQVFIKFDVARTMRLHAAKSTVFAYLFDVPFNGKAIKCATHGDDGAYVFDWGNWGNQGSSSPDAILLDRMTTMFTNFVKYQNPVPQTNDLLPVAWQPMKPNDVDTFLNIAYDLVAKEEDIMGEPDGPFWTKLFKDLRDQKSI